MRKVLFYPVGSSDSCRYASQFLAQAGFSLTDHPMPEITHLLLDVPDKLDDHQLKELLRRLPADITIAGGRLNQEALTGYSTFDLLEDPLFLAKNAAITAECAIRVAAPYLPSTFSESPAILLGWGRIGRCLAKLLAAVGCEVTIAARKAQDRAMAEALGFKAVEFSRVPKLLHQYRVLFNTVPAQTIPEDALDQWQEGIAIDLASEPGMAGAHVIAARGLPGKYAPESAGRLICETVIKFCKEENV